jgi:hypothetical protein
MIRDDDIKMLAEINRIVDRYGPESVNRLASLIRDPQFADNMATVLERMAESATPREARARPRSHDRIGMGVLNELRDSDPQKHAIVADFRERLIAGSLLKTMNELRQFARARDLGIGKASSRNAAIAPLLRSISEWETPAIIDLLDSMTSSGSDDRSLERWRDLIVKPRVS